MSIIKEIKLVTLEEMRVIAFHGFGKSPEEIAWKNLTDWIKKNGFEGMVDSQRFFGFNNPNPAPGSDNYGYEQWMTLPADYMPKDGETIRVLQAGLYAVGGFRNDAYSSFGPAWQSLNDWRVDSDYVYDESRQWLEELLSKEGVLNPSETGSFDCFMPIMKI